VKCTRLLFSDYSFIRRTICLRKNGTRRDASNHLILVKMAKKAFYSSFIASIQGLHKNRNPLTRKDVKRKIPTTESADLDALKREIHALQARLTAAIEVGDVGGFDEKRCGEELGGVKNDLEKRREEVIPRKGFSFKNRRTASFADSLDSVPQTQEKVHVNALDVVEKAGLVVKLDAGEQDVQLTRLRNCVVLVRNVANLHILDVEACLVIAPCVRGSLRMTGAKACQVLIDCRQVRIHDSKDTCVVVKCSSKPILEGCNGMLWASWSGDIDEAWVDTVAARWLGASQRSSRKHGPKVFVEGVGEWKNVQDFEWLKAGASPHWTFMDAAACEDWPFACKLA